MQKPFPFQKRVVPDDEPISKSEPVKEEVKVEPVKEVVKQVVREEPEREVVKRVVKEEPIRKVKEVVHDKAREKYTAMMDKDLRIRVKIASVRLGIDVSKYIEEAVLEKLEKDGAE